MRVLARIGAALGIAAVVAGATTRVATYPDDDLGLCTHDGIDYGTLSLTTTVPGGIDHVVIRLTDVNHKISHYANCYRTASTCQQG
jgi:hypothetical protein